MAPAFAEVTLCGAAAFAGVGAALAGAARAMPAAAAAPTNIPATSFFRIAILTLVSDRIDDFRWSSESRRERDCHAA
jgi:hypothetical protein